MPPPSTTEIRRYTNAGARIAALARGTLADLGRSVDPRERLELIVELTELLDTLTDEARQLRAGTIIDLRLPAAGDFRPAYTWAAITLLTGRDITPSAVQQWADQYRGATE